MVTFVEVVVPDRMRHPLARSTQAFRRETADGMFLRVITAIEPVKTDEAYGRHVSVSVGNLSGNPVRLPTNDECKLALRMWPRTRFEEDNIDSNGRCRHFWEV